MSAADLAAVVAAIVSLVGVALLTYLSVRVLRATRELEAAVADLRDRTEPLLEDAAAAVHDAAQEAARVSEILDTAEAISSRVDGASRVAYLALSKPVIKTAAAATGAQRAARRMRGQPEPPRRRRTS